MNCSKSTCEMYRVRANGEYATVCLSVWSRETVAQPSQQVYGGEILVHSSFGTFCHTWNHCAVPFKQFLLGISFESFMTKCLGEEFEHFDGLASVVSVKTAILESRREEGLSAEDARNLWDELELVSDEAQSCEYAFHHVLSDLCTEDSIGASTEFVMTTPSNQAKGFWRELWPHFRAMLDAEVNPDQHAAHAA